MARYVCINYPACTRGATAAASPCPKCAAAAAGEGGLPWLIFRSDAMAVSTLRALAGLTNLTAKGRATTAAGRLPRSQG